MPLNTKKVRFSQYEQVITPDSKKILIQETTVFLVIFFVLFKAAAYFWPEDVSVTQTLSHWVLALPSLLRDYPTVTGVVLSYIAWHVTYLNSAVPGVDPPSPLSPSKHREKSGANFHLDYVVAILIGPLVTCLMYLEWV